MPQGHVIPPVPAWTDVAGLNYTSPALREYMIAMLKYWIKEADVDGFRCDVAYMVPTDFWEQVRAELTKVKPDIMMLAEASKPELLANAFDIDYSWPLLATMNNVLHPRRAGFRRAQVLGRKPRASSRRTRCTCACPTTTTKPAPSPATALNGALAASALMFTLDGVPLLYNGMEVGDATESGDPALFDKLNIFWHPKERPQLRSIYHDLIQLRKQSAAFRSDNVEWLHNSDETKLVTFLRADDKDEFLVVINFSNRPLIGKVELKNADGFSAVKIPAADNSGGGPLPDVHLNGFEWRIYHRLPRDGRKIMHFQFAVFTAPAPCKNHA